MGRYAWQLEVVECFQVPIQARGQQGIWKWEREPTPLALVERTSPEPTSDADQPAPPPPEGWYRWALTHFGPLDYPKPEFYARSLYALELAKHTLKATPTFTNSDRIWLGNIMERLREFNVPNRGRLIQERRELEHKREAYQKASGAVLGAEMTFNRAYREIPADVRVAVERIRYGQERNYDEIVRAA